MIYELILPHKFFKGHVLYCIVVVSFTLISGLSLFVVGSAISLVFDQVPFSIFRSNERQTDDSYGSWVSIN